MTTNFTKNEVDIDQLLLQYNQAYKIPLEFRNPDFPMWGNSLWWWGQPAAGVNVSSPIQVGTLVDWKTLSSGLPKFAIKTDGTLWAWGANGAGQLGLGDITNRVSPVQVGALTDWKYVYAGLSTTAAIKKDGTLWWWGATDTTQVSSPVQVGALTDWKQVSIGSSGSILAVKTDGTLWAWGSNSSGQLGLGDTVHRSSPVQVGALTDWSQVDVGFVNAAAIKTDGTLWTWGNNTQGQLGVNDRTHRSSPVQVGTLTNWKQVAINSKSPTISGAVLSVKTDGTLWAWGAGNDGCLGIGVVAYRSSPVQVGTLTNWKQVVAECGTGNNGTMAIKTDGTLWAWGSNTAGQLGLGDTVHRSSPVQVGAYNNWKQVAIGAGGGINASTTALTR